MQSNTLYGQEDEEKPKRKGGEGTHTLNKKFDEKDWMTGFHQSVTDGVYQSALWFDNFFSDDANKLLTPKTTAKIRLSWQPQARDWSEFKAKFKVKVKLPHFQNKVDLILSDDDDTTLNQLPLENSDPRLALDEDKFAAAIRYIHKEESDRLTTSRIGITGGDIFVRGRHERRFFVNDKHSFKVEPSLYYFLDEGFSERLLLEYDYQYNPKTQFRINYSIRGSQEYSGIRWKHGFYRLHQLDNATATLTSLQVEGQRNGERGFLIERYTLGYRYRFNAYRKWLFFEVEPFLEWHEQDNYSTTPGIALRVEGIFAKGY
jgi:hypothetical protein